MFRKNKNLQTVNLFLRRLAYLIKNHTPLNEALKQLARDISVATFKESILKISENIETGKSLTSACSLFPEYFSSFCLKVMDLGERVGKLDLVLLQYVEFMDKKNFFRKKLTAMLIYPVIIFIVFLISIIFLFTYVFPQITTLFSDTQQDLPLLTTIIISTIDLIKQYGFIIILSIITISLLVVKYLYMFKEKKAIHKYLLKIPFIKHLFLKIELLNICSALDVCINSGYNFLDSLKISQGLIKNSYTAHNFNTAIAKIEEGQNPAMALEEIQIFPSFFISIIQSAIKDGNLKESFNYIVTTYEKELEIEIETLSRLIEPVLIIFLGGIIGIVVLSVLLPILNLNQIAG